MSTQIVSARSQPPRLMDQLRDLAHRHFGRPEPGQRYTHWALRFILFHGKRHPRDMGSAELELFLTDRCSARWAKRESGRN